MIKEVNFHSSNTHTVCPYKEQTSDYTLTVNGENHQDAAWFYPTTRRGFEKIVGYIAFWWGVKINE